MRVVMSTSKIWKNSIGAISNIIDEGAFNFSSEGVKMEAMDPSHVAMVDFHISSSAFEEYSVDESTSIGLDLIELNKIISRAGKNDEVILEVSDERDRLNLTFMGASTRRFSIPIIDTAEEEIPSPDLDFTAKAKIQAGVIKDGIKDTSLISDNVNVTLSEEEFKMMSESDTGSAETEVSKKEDVVRNLEVNEPSKAMYNIDYLSDIMKASSSGDFTTVRAGKDIPIQIVFSMADGDAKLEFVLAPRVESE
ncbi:hypothetical protein AKJ51_00115 [candidate division MSBL1 archaeon SCGC-AAA382A20]|uniref:DNA polymerase sliding clamp n=1 Tax=candidate division MSBL1 archaeon SCGC-AAA382A20 TaxID=1698280 RepID=A0A133VMS7_9EURY|nr:hypothetical protein AKJ51_00115 [candidate division MSBL1 archaeon SCGC-AAA382A20]